MNHSEWTDAYKRWQEQVDALVARHRHIQRLALLRAELKDSFSFKQFCDRHRIRFNQELDRISTP